MRTVLFLAVIIQAFSQSYAQEIIEPTILKTYECKPPDIQFVKGRCPLLVKMRDTEGNELGYFALCDENLTPMVKFPYKIMPPYFFAHCEPSRNGNYFMVQTQGLYHPQEAILYDKHGKIMWKKKHHFFKPDIEAYPGYFCAVSDKGYSICNYSTGGDIPFSHSIEFYDIDGKPRKYYERPTTHDIIFSGSGDLCLLGFDLGENHRRQELVLFDGTGNIIWKKKIKKSRIVGRRKFSKIKKLSLSPDGNLVFVSSTALGNTKGSPKKTGTYILNRKGELLRFLPIFDVRYVYSDDGKHLIIEDWDVGFNYVLNLQTNEVVYKNTLSSPSFINNKLDIIGNVSGNTRVITLEGRIIARLGFAKYALFLYSLGENKVFTLLQRSKKLVLLKIPLDDAVQ